MKAFIAFILTNIVLGAICGFVLRGYYPDLFRGYDASQTQVMILYPKVGETHKDAPLPGEVRQIQAAISALGFTDVAVSAAQTSRVPTWTLQNLPLLGIIACFCICTPIFISFAILYWGLSIFE